MRPFRGTTPKALIRSFVTIVPIVLLLAVSSQSFPAQVGAPVGTTPSLLKHFQSLLPGDSLKQAESNSNSAGAAIEGWVKSAATGKPVEGATVKIGSMAQTQSDASGYFRFEASQVQSGAKLAATTLDIPISVSAPGFPAWSLSSATYYVGDTLRIYPKLGNSMGVSGVEPGIPASLASFDASPPATIRVYRTQTGAVEVVPFRDYLKHTLPNEWIPSWSAASLKAGAMAVKTYAWYWVLRGGKQAALGADLKDNVEDQVYDPNVSYASTDSAVDATYNYVMTRNGAVFQAQYCAGSYIPDPTGDCPWPAPYLTQWGSAYYGDQGRSWAWLLGFYYPGVVISPTPPGGGYDGTPVPATVNPVPTKAVATRQPLHVASTQIPVTTYAVGQGSNQADVFQEAYDRNGGMAVLGVPTGVVRWWMTYVSEDNVLVQPFSGSQGQGNTWLVLDVLKSGQPNAQRAFMLSGDIASAYKGHSPMTGPEWVGAPTTDPYVASAGMGGMPSQGFAKGILAWNGQKVVFTPWPDKFADWRADFFIGYMPTLPGVEPEQNLPGRPALVTNLAAPVLHWPADPAVSQSMGVGRGSWSVQLTKNMTLTAGSYDFNISANSGVRLWVDGLLAVNSWTRVEGGDDHYNVDLDSGPHTVRVQYFNTGGGTTANLDLTFAPRSAASATPVQITDSPLMVNGGLAALRAKMTFLGRQASQGGFVQPVSLYLSDPSTSNVLYSYSGETDRNGVAYFGNLPSGTFDVHVKGQQTLQSARANITLTDNTVTDTDMKYLLAGDVDGDNCVTVDDFSIVQAMLGADKNTSGFNAAADLNGDGVVTLSDISLMRAGFDRCGDISADVLSADGDFQTLTVGASPSLSELLLPWTQPERLNHGLTLGLTAPRTAVRHGDTLDVEVMADTSTQPIDGASYIVSYDPKKLKLVDSTGNDATGSDPGAALPAVMGNWVDKQGGFVGYSAGMLQGEAPEGAFAVATLHFRVLSGGQGTTRVDFAPINSANMQLTDGGTNLLARTIGLELKIIP